MKKKVICLLGPTATGKTESAFALADQLPIDIISVDSAMIYRGMDIGTAKPNREILKRYPHQLIDICTPIERYSAVEFRKDAREAIEKSFQNGRIPLLVGGTFLYFKTLLEGISPIPATTPEILDELNDQLEREGVNTLYQELKEVDPESADRLNPNDTQRITRALAVYRMSGKTLSHFWKLPNIEPLPYPTLKLGLYNNNVALRNRAIETRYHQMIEEGLVEEVEMLLHTYPELSLDYPSLRAVGYRQIYQYLIDELNLDEAIERAIIATRQYAKRQRTWLRSEKNLTSIDAEKRDHHNALIEVVSQFLAKD